MITIKKYQAGPDPILQKCQNVRPDPFPYDPFP